MRESVCGRRWLLKQDEDVADAVGGKEYRAPASLPRLIVRGGVERYEARAPLCEGGH
jgi:hypothetical protein